MYEPSYIIELAARHFNLSAKEMCSSKSVKNALKSRIVAYILLHGYCELEPYRIAPIFGTTEGNIKVTVSQSTYDMVIQNAVKEIEDKYLIVNDKNEVV